MKEFLQGSDEWPHFWLGTKCRKEEIVCWEIRITYGGGATAAGEPDKWR